MAKIVKVTQIGSTDGYPDENKVISMGINADHILKIEDSGLTTKEITKITFINDSELYVKEEKVELAKKINN